MAVTSMRSVRSRARRMVMARESGLARGILVPCICKTPCLDDRARHAHGLPMPGPLVAPEVGLKAWNRLEACRLHDVASGLVLRLRIAIRVAKRLLSQMSRGLAETGVAAPRRRDRPDVD